MGVSTKEGLSYLKLAPLNIKGPLFKINGPFPRKVVHHSNYNGLDNQLKSIYFLSKVQQVRKYCRKNKLIILIVLSHLSNRKKENNVFLKPFPKNLSLPENFEVLLFSFLL